MDKAKMGLEMKAFAAAVRESIQQAMSGKGRVTTPEQIIARRRGLPVGSVLSEHKVAATHSPV